MFCCCILYCFTAMPKFEISSLFKNLIIFGSIPLVYFSLKDKNYDKKIIWLFLASFVIQIVSWVNSLIVIPEYARSAPDVKVLSSLFLFVFISFWIGSSKKKRLVLFSTLVFSFIFTVLHHNYLYDSFSLAFSGQRVDFGLHNAQYTTMIAAVIMMVSIYMSPQNIKENKNSKIILLTVIIAFSAIVFVVSQTRQVWLAMAIILFILPLLTLKKWSRSLIGGLYLIIFSLGVLGLNSNIIQKRTSGDGQAVERIISGDWDNIPMTSSGVRFNSWLEARSWILESPILGASKSAVKQVIQQSELFQSNDKTKGFGHLHNYYIETIVSFGFIGFVFLIFFYITVYNNITHYADHKTKIFFICFLGFWLIINNFESYNSKYYGLYIQNILLGGLFFMPKPKVEN